MKTSLLAIALFGSLTLIGQTKASDDTNRHTIYAGVSSIGSDYGDLSHKKPVSLGYDYTFSSGLVVGGSFTSDFASSTKNKNHFYCNFESSALDLYIGHHFDNNVRLTGGLSLLFSDVTLSTSQGYYSENARGLGANLGLDYVYNNVLIGLRAALYDGNFDYVDASATKLTFNLGYKF